jgi:hypothetical protein
VLQEGSIVARGSAKDVVGGYDGGGPARNGGSGGPGRSSGGIVASRHLSDERELHVPQVVPAFNAFAALHSATLTTSTGRKRVDAAADEVTVEIHFETAEPDVEAHCGVVFAARDGDGPGIRLELPEPLRFVEPRNYVLVARTLPGALRPGFYDVRADAILADPSGNEATVIARDIGRLRILGDEEELDAEDLAEPPVTHWDGLRLGRVEAEWSVE